MLEAMRPEAFESRHGQIIDAIVASAADAICLQEFWFDDRLSSFYEQSASRHGYTQHTLRRTAWNSSGRSEDGLALWVRDSALEVVDRHAVCFQDYGIPQDRVALLLVLQDRRRGGAFAVLCTHLTFPHNSYDMQCRLTQIQACLKAVDAHVPPGMPVVVAGDLNGQSTDVVGEHLRRSGYVSAWDHLHGRPCEITHADHRGQFFASDHVWVRGAGALAPCEAWLLPDGVPDSAPMQRPAIGGAGAVAGTSSTLASWCQLSDHRPLAVMLQWGGE